MNRALRLRVAAAMLLAAAIIVVVLTLMDPPTLQPTHSRVDRFGQLLHIIARRIGG